MLPGCPLRWPGRRAGGTAWPGQMMSASQRRAAFEQVLSCISGVLDSMGPAAVQ